MLSHDELLDASAMTMRRRVEEFLRFSKELAELGAKQDETYEDEQNMDPV